LASHWVSHVPLIRAKARRVASYEEMRECIRYLERQVDEEREARRRADTPLARLMYNTLALGAAPELPAPARTREEPTLGAEEGGVRVRLPTERHGGSDELRGEPWWRGMLGG
jgi:hypothetical protein